MWADEVVARLPRLPWRDLGPEEARRLFQRQDIAFVLQTKRQRGAALEALVSEGWLKPVETPPGLPPHWRLLAFAPKTGQ